MPRPPRRDALGTLHHVMGRGLERTPLFRRTRTGPTCLPAWRPWRNRGPSRNTPGRSSRTTPRHGTRRRLSALSVGILLLSLARFAALATRSLTQVRAALARGIPAVTLAVCPP
jgi:hypothetical protein